MYGWKGANATFKEIDRSLTTEKSPLFSCIDKQAGEIVPVHMSGETFGIARGTACKVFKGFIFAVIEVSYMLVIFRTSHILIICITGTVFGCPQSMRDDNVKRSSGARMKEIKADFARKGFYKISHPNLPWLVTVFPGHDTNLPS